MQANLVIKSKTATENKKITTTITYLRSEQKSHATELGQALNALTTNTLESIQVNELNVDPTTSPNLPQEISITYAQASGTYVYTVHRLGTGRIAAYYGTTSMTVDQTTGTFSYNAVGPFIILVDSDGTYSQGYLRYERT